MPAASPLPAFDLTRSKDAPLDLPPLFTRLSDKGPVTRVLLREGLSTWVVTRWEDARAVLGNPAFSSDPTLPGAPTDREERERPAPGLFVLHDDPVHSSMRRTVSREFMVKRVDALRPAIVRLTGELLDSLTEHQGQPVDLVEHFALPLPSLVICKLLGVPYEDHEFFQEQARQLLDRTVPIEEFQQVLATFSGYLLGLVQVKRVTPGDDVLSRLVAQADEGVITDKDIADICTLLLIGGHETTANMIALSTFAMLQHPEQIPYLLAGPEQAVKAVDELLRYLTIVHLGLRRTALEDVTVGGVTIRAGEGVIISLNVANRDPDFFADADDLNLDREDARRHLAFGFGIHHCVGQALARAELEIVLPEIFRRLPGLKLAVPLEEITYKQDSAAYGVDELPVTW